MILVHYISLPSKASTIRYELVLPYVKGKFVLNLCSIAQIHHVQ